MRKILVPCDFSKPSQNAFRLAMSIAARNHGMVYLLNVQPLPLLLATGLTPTLYLEEAMLKGVSEDAELKLLKLAASAGSSEVTVVRQVAFGDVCDQSISLIRENDIDLVIMGSHGVSGFNDHVIGSNVSTMIRRSEIPVLIVKHPVNNTIKNIIFPTTLEENEDRTFMQRLNVLQHFFDATIHIVWINTRLELQTDASLKEKMKRLAADHNLLNYTLNIFNGIGETEGIVEFAKSIGGDLIAMGTHARKGIARVLLGSIAESVAYHTEFPIWTMDLTSREVAAVEKAESAVTDF